MYIYAYWRYGLINAWQACVTLAFINPKNLAHCSEIFSSIFFRPLSISYSHPANISHSENFINNRINSKYKNEHDLNVKKMREWNRKYNFWRRSMSIVYICALAISHHTATHTHTHIVLCAHIWSLCICHKYTKIYTTYPLCTHLKADFGVLIFSYTKLCIYTYS